MFDADFISVLCDAAGVAGFILALWQLLGSRTRFRVSDTSIRLIGGHSGELLALVSLSFLNLSSVAACADTILLQADTSDAIHPLSATQCLELLQANPGLSQEERAAVGTSSAFPVNIPAHTGCRIALLYPVAKDGALFHSLFGHAGDEPSRPCKREYCVPNCQDCVAPLRLVLSVRGRTFRRWLDMDKVRIVCGPDRSLLV